MATGECEYKGFWKRSPPRGPSRGCRVPGGTDLVGGVYIPIYPRRYAPVRHTIIIGCNYRLEDIIKIFNFRKANAELIGLCRHRGYDDIRPIKQGMTAVRQSDYINGITDDCKCFHWPPVLTFVLRSRLAELLVQVQHTDVAAAANH